MTGAQEHREGMFELENEDNNPHTCTWNGVTYACLKGSLTNGKTLGSGGFAVDADLVLIIGAELFPTAAEQAGGRPVAQQKIIHADQTFKITDIVIPAGDPFLKLICVDANRGA